MMYKHTNFVSFVINFVHIYVVFAGKCVFGDKKHFAVFARKHVVQFWENNFRGFVGKTRFWEKMCCGFLAEKYILRYWRKNVLWWEIVFCGFQWKICFYRKLRFWNFGENAFYDFAENFILWFWWKICFVILVGKYIFIVLSFFIGNKMILDLAM